MSKRGLAPERAATPTTAIIQQPARKVPERKAATPRKQICIGVSEELHERYVNAVAALSGPPTRLTYVALAREAIEQYLTHLEREHNRGRPFAAARKR